MGRERCLCHECECQGLFFIWWLTVHAHNFVLTYSQVVVVYCSLSSTREGNLELVSNLYEVLLWQDIVIMSSSPGGLTHRFNWKIKRPWTDIKESGLATKSLFYWWEVGVVRGWFETVPFVVGIEYFVRNILRVHKMGFRPLNKQGRQCFEQKGWLTFSR